MKRFLIIALAILLGLGARAPAQDRPPAVPPVPVSSPVRLETGPGVLHGVLDLPAGDGPHPVVVVIAGSGPTDRDGNQPSLRTDNLKQLGRGLSSRGIAALRYDRRGIGESRAAATQEEDLRFERLAEDAALWVEMLRRDRRFSKVGLVGHSEGSTVGILAAKRSKVDAFVSIAGPGRDAPTVLREQLARNLSPALKAKSDPIIDELAAGRTVPNPPKELAALFRPSVQPYLISYFKYDPTREIASLKIPVLVLQGTTDLQVSVEDARRLAEAANGSRLRIIEGMNHSLKRVSSAAGQQLSYFVSSLPLAPEVVEEVAGIMLDAPERRP